MVQYIDTDNVCSVLFYDFNSFYSKDSNNLHVSPRVNKNFVPEKIISKKPDRSSSLGSDTSDSIDSIDSIDSTYPNFTRHRTRGTKYRSKTLYVEGLSLSTNKDEVFRFFNSHQSIREIRMSKTRTNKRLCFIEFASIVSASFMLEQKDTKRLNNKTIYISYSVKY